MMWKVYVQEDQHDEMGPWSKKRGRDTGVRQEAVTLKRSLNFECGSSYDGDYDGDLHSLLTEIRDLSTMAELTQQTKNSFFPMADGVKGGNNGNPQDKGTEDTDKAKLRTLQDRGIQVAAVRGPNPPAPTKGTPPQTN